MGSKKTLSELRNSLEKIMTQIGSANNGEVSNSDAIRLLISNDPGLVDELRPQLVNIALTKPANEVGNRKGPKSGGNIGFDLFGKYHGVPKMIVINKGKKRDTSKATFQEVDLWLNAHDVAVDEREIKNFGFKRLVNECRPFATSPDDTLEQAMRRKMEAEGKLDQLNILESANG